MIRMVPPFVQRVIDAVAAQADTAFALRLPDGGVFRAGDGQPRFTLAFHTDRALAAATLHGHMGLLEAYFDQTLDVEGDLGAAFAAGLAAGIDTKVDLLTRLENGLHELRHSNRASRQARANARAHYGLPAAFYRLWLDQPLQMYTCAYWPEGTTTLEEAQCRKVDHVCRKIRLGPDDRFLDIGCGFGGFMLRAAETTGAHGVGINTTPEQVEWLRGEIARRGLDQRLAVRQVDCRDIEGPYDKVVSIGVLEHAGRDQLAEVIRAHAKVLAPGGLGLLHFIGHVGRHETDLFIRKHVFPGGWIPALADVIVAMERCGLEIVDIENLRRHYALTLDEWARRFDAQWPNIHALDPTRFDERFRRLWLSYLVGCAEMFRSPASYTHLFQIVFSKGNLRMNDYPMSRAFLYD
ncbi:MAG: class I SAM-dependent methyltransferase [Leptothrix sp. (in: b-proteobacteria)]